MVRVVTRMAALLGLALGGVIAVAGAPGSAQTGETQTLTFGCTGAPEEWVVPDGVTSATVQAFGAEGGIGDGGQPDEPSSAAGQGGSFQATIAVTPGETIQVNVGCVGDPSGGLTGGGGDGGFGGSPGGDGGNGGDLGHGGGGGGSSDVRQGGTSLADRVVVAGGGGGSGGANDETTDGEGGGGGGTAGENGGDTTNAGGGQGGTPTTNGAGGTLASCTASGEPGDTGTEAQGGNALDGPSFGAGGGGGGGFRGGGGGAGCVNGGGGGGGSGFAIASATDVSQDVGVRSGDGQVTITFTPEAAAGPVAAEPVFTG